MSISEEVIKIFDDLFFIKVESKDNLRDLGLDSLDTVSLTQLLEQKFSICIPDIMVDEEKDVQAVIDLVTGLVMANDGN